MSKLEGDKATEFHIPSLVNHTHAAFAEFFDHAVVRDDLADQLVLISHWPECYGDACGGVNCEFRRHVWLRDRLRTARERRLRNNARCHSPYHQKKKAVRLRGEEAF